MRLRFLNDLDQTETLVFKPNDRSKVINCSVVGGRPFEVSWFRNGYPYASDTDGQSSNVLQLNQPNVNDSGTYACRANDSVSSIEQLINITIACKLPCNSLYILMK